MTDAATVRHEALGAGHGEVNRADLRGEVLNLSAAGTVVRPVDGDRGLDGRVVEGRVDGRRDGHVDRPEQQDVVLHDVDRLDLQGPAERGLQPTATTSPPRVAEEAVGVETPAVEVHGAFLS